MKVDIPQKKKKKITSPLPSSLPPWPLLASLSPWCICDQAGHTSVVVVVVVAMEAERM